MNTIYKYKVEWGTKTKVTVPFGSQNQILDIEFQGNDLFLWALVDTDTKETIDVDLEIYGTGWSMVNTYRLNHLKTLHHGGYVWHVFVRN